MLSMGKPPSRCKRLACDLLKNATIGQRLHVSGLNTSVLIMFHILRLFQTLERQGKGARSVVDHGRWQLRLRHRSYAAGDVWIRVRKDESSPSPASRYRSCAMRMSMRCLITTRACSAC